ncbi:MAG: hypothetical protein GX895_00945 [Clostridiales bacterium]|uniref:hypothetical protein n=1 Tax=Clostridium sp. N3C TaxID=1776758 RepID=UPI00092E1306|nr:hypothetical protein [Clostridium sp. N3C]NLZ47351.1 hypothetical protein [Clostridiales bacterium]SCN21365.1 hypothetical protein N3C_0141 [Clostridium sp. N3C]
MLRLRIKKGNTLLDVMISLCVFALMFLAAFDMYMAKARLKNQNNLLANYLNCVEVAAGNICLNHSYEELLNYSGENIWYISSQHLSVEELRQPQILSLLKPSTDNEDTYLSVKISGDDVLKLSFKLKYTIGGKVDVIEYETYKGSYN